jgi:hypothetical protein
MEISNCEMQIIDKSTILNVFWHAYPAGYLRTEEKSSSDKDSRIASFTSLKLSDFGNDKASSEFKSKIASLQNFIVLE